jgi:methyltransferase-like protein
MENYLGSFEVAIENTPFKVYTPIDWIEYFIMRYGGIDGSHHKDWVLDQCMQICNGTEVMIEEARWGNGQTEYRVSLKEPSEKYKERIQAVCGDDYEWNCGIAP